MGQFLRHAIAAQMVVKTEVSMDEYRTHFDLDALILLAHINRTNMEQSGESEGDVIARTDIVFAVWPDPTKVETVSVMPIKGGRKMLRMPLERHTDGASVTALLCASQQEANAFRQQYGGNS